MPENANTDLEMGINHMTSHMCISFSLLPSLHGPPSMAIPLATAEGNNITWMQSRDVLAIVGAINTKS